MSPDQDPISPEAEAPMPLSAEAVVSAVYKGLLEQIVSHLEKVRDTEDIEALHDLRVALRRMRAALKGLDILPEPVQVRALDDFAQLSGWTGKARDLDVLLSKRAKYQDRVTPNLQPALSAYFDHLEKLRTLARQEIRTWLGAPGVLDKLDAFRTELALWEVSQGSESLEDLIQGRIHRQYKKVRHLARSLENQQETQAIHLVRIQLKKLRYLIELFRDQIPEKLFRHLLDSFKQLQDLLGDFNDLTVHIDLLEAHLKDKTLGLTQETQWSIAMLLGSLHQSRRLLERKCLKTIRAFLKGKIKARFAYFKREEPPMEEA